MRGLLDVNVLLALLDQDHAFHQRARAWLTDTIDQGWASCPITQTGFVRIISSPRYPSGITVANAIGLLTRATNDPHHEFWSDDLPLTSDQLERSQILGPSQITDVYLLGLAVAHGGRFVTFDQRVGLAAVPAAKAAYLLQL